MILVSFFETMVVILVLCGALFQVILPLYRGEPLFPIFDRKRVKLTRRFRKVTRSMSNIRLEKIVAKMEEEMSKENKPPEQQ